MLTAYVDASVLLRVLAGQPDALPEWSSISAGVASELIDAECLRALDRMRIRQMLDDQTLATRRAAAMQLLASLERVELNRTVLARVADPMPTEIGTLDAIHLSTALLWRDTHPALVNFATHDRALGLAARASGFRVLGLD